MNSPCIAAVHARCLEAERKVVGSGEGVTEVVRHVGRGYLVGCGCLTKSTVRRTSDSRLVLTTEGEVWKSRFEGESGLDDGM